MKGTIYFLAFFAGFEGFAGFLAGFAFAAGFALATGLAFAFAGFVSFAGLADAGFFAVTVSTFAGVGAVAAFEPALTALASWKTRIKSKPSCVGR